MTIHSIELWAEGGRLVAGELGYACGSMYTSLTGFNREPGTGKVQMLALGGLLVRGGFKCWDLGMGMDYKAALGTSMIDRAEFVALQRSLCDDAATKAELPARGISEGLPAAELVAEVLRAKAEAGGGDGPAAAAAGDGAPMAVDGVGRAAKMAGRAANRRLGAP